MLLDDKFLDFKFICPFPKQTFGCYNFNPNPKFLPPVLLLTRSIKFLLVVKFDGKLLDSKKSVWLFSYKILGEVRN